MTRSCYLFLLGRGAVGCEAEGPETPDECEDLIGPVEVEGEITSDTAWRCDTVSYVLTDDVFVGGGATLTVGPGVTVQAADQAAIVISNDAMGGAIVADGTEAPILFTSTEDVKEPGQWEGIVIDGNATRAELRSVVVEYAGDDTSDGSRSGMAGVLVIGEASVVDATIRHSGHHGVQMMEDGRMAAFSGNTFTDNAAPSVSVHAPHVGTLEGPNTFDDGDVVRVEGGVVATSATWSSLGAPYEIVDDVFVEGVTEPAVVDVAPGATLRMGDQVAFVVGYGGPGGLVADASGGEPVVFTSAEAVPAPGDWEGLVFDGNTTVGTLRNVQIRYGGDDTSDFSGSTRGGLVVADVGITVTDSTFDRNAIVGVQLLGDVQMVAFSDNTFVGSDEAAIDLLANSVASLSGPNTFEAGDRVRIDGGTVTASGTWADLGAPYELVDDVAIEGTDAPAIALEAGVELQMGDQVTLAVGTNDAGSLTAVADTAPIVFTSNRPVPAPGDWEAVVIDGNGDATLDGVTFEYCGDDTSSASASFQACLGVVGPASPSVRSCAFRDSQTHGIELRDGGSIVDPGETNTFDGIGGDDIHVH